MTREEAKMILEEVKIMDDSMYQYNTKYLEALDMAIKALEQLTSYEQTINKLTKAISEQEPCEDCISRQAVLDGIDTYISKAQSTGTQDDFYSFAELVVKELPSVNPQPCKDMISRADAIDACNQSINLFEAVDRIKELPRK